MSGKDIRIDGSTIIDVGTTRPKTITGLSTGLHTFELRNYNDAGVRSDWEDPPLHVFLINEVTIRLDSGRTSGGVVGGFDIDTAYLVGSVSAQDFADTVDISGLIDPAPAAAYSKQRTFASSLPTYTFDHPDLIEGRKYLIRCHFNEANTSHVLGESVMVVTINGTEAAPIKDPSFRNSKFFDVRERAGAFHRGYIREYLGTVVSGEITVAVNAAINNTGGDVKIAAIELLEAPPVASFTATPGANQNFPVVFADTSTGDPTMWLLSFGDGTTSTVQNPSHVYPAAGDYTVTLIASNPYGDSEAFSMVVTVPTATALTVTPSSLAAVTQGVAGSQTIGATGGTGPYTIVLVDEGSDARNQIAVSADEWHFSRRGALPNGLSLSSGGVLSGTPDLSAVKPSLIVLEGDSIVKGVTSVSPVITDDYTPGAWLAKLLPRSWEVVNIATGGETFGMMVSEYPSQAAPWYNSAYQKCIYFLSSGHNDILGGTSLATMKSNTQSLMDSAKATGFQTICATIVPDPYYLGGDATKLTDYNTWVKTTLTNVDHVLDWTDNPLLANQRHNTYFEQGGIHNTPLGCIQRAVSIKAAIDALSATGSGSIAVDYKFAVKVTDALGNAATKQYTLTVNP